MIKVCKVDEFTLYNQHVLNAVLQLHTPDSQSTSTVSSIYLEIVDSTETTWPSK